MKAVILAGGMGSRISEESCLRPKPMITIGGQPILWHIMKIYGAYGVHDFVICCGYKGHIIKDYFINYATYHSNITKSLKDGTLHLDGKRTEPWKVTLVNTGLHTKTAGRLLKIRDYIGTDDFMMTYGDGVADINIADLLCFHQSHGRIATITAARPIARFGTMEIDERQSVRSFREKSKEKTTWVNAGFAVFSPKIFDYLGDGSHMLEEAPYETLARNGQMKAYYHQGCWAPMDTIHDRNYLETLWKKDEAFWKLW